MTTIRPTLQTTIQPTADRKAETVAVEVLLAIRATPEAIWHGLTDGTVTPGYYVGYEAHFGDLVPGTSYSYTSDTAEVITGTVLEVEPARRLRMSFNGHWDPAVGALPESVVTFDLREPFMPMPGVTFLSCVHEQLSASGTAEHLRVGWVSILSGLKTLLETGTPMVTPGG